MDKDISYVYYLDSGERIHLIVHNIYEFFNFCCIHEMRVKKYLFTGIIPCVQDIILDVFLLKNRYAEA